MMTASELSVIITLFDVDFPTSQKLKGTKNEVFL